MPFKCEWPGCDKQFPQIFRLELHHSSHIGLKTFECDWPECGRTFRYIISYMQMIYFIYIYVSNTFNL